MAEKKQVGKKSSVNFDLQLNQEQQIAKENILKHPYSFIEGRAGTGKTMLAVQIALDLVFKKEKERIVITRPTVSTEDNGFLPGSEKEKLEPWLVPIKDNMRQVYNHQDKLDTMEKDRVIEIVPLTYFRGRTFRNAVCILDEAQNLTVSQLKMAIGRLGPDSIMIFCGDSQQIDLKNKSESALHVVERIIKHPAVYSVRLMENHRHPAINELLQLLE